MKTSSKCTNFIVFTRGSMVKVFANGPGDSGSVPSQVMPKISKLVFDASLLNTQHYKVQIKMK